MLRFVLAKPTVAAVVGMPSECLVSSVSVVFQRSFHEAIAVVSNAMHFLCYERE